MCIKDIMLREIRDFGDAKDFSMSYLAEDFDEIKDLRDQHLKNHPSFEAQNLLTGAGKPIMSPTQRRQTAQDLRLIRDSVKHKKLKTNFSFINEAFDIKEYQSGHF